MNIKRKDEIKAFFNELIKECEKDGAYSVAETAEKMGVSYSQLQEWAKSIDIGLKAIDFCRMICGDNAEKDGMYGKIPAEESFKYMCENDDEFKEYYDKQKAIELREKLEEAGEEIPPTKTEGFVMIEEITKKSEQFVNADVNENLPANIPMQQQTKQEIEAERIKTWKERVKKSTPCFKVKPSTTKNEMEKNAVVLTSEATGDEQPTQELVEATLCATFGSANRDYATKLLALSLNGFFKNPNDEVLVHGANTANEINGALLSLNPKDEIEGMLCTRLLVLHDQYMEFMKRTANGTQTCAGIDLNINRSTKLMRLYNETLEALMRYKRKGEQKVTVQHVNVNKGGQAVVNGQLNQGEGSDAKK